MQWMPILQPGLCLNHGHNPLKANQALLHFHTTYCSIAEFEEESRGVLGRQKARISTKGLSEEEAESQFGPEQAGRSEESM
ncbi:hypothetical protein KM043_013069 [Ampulex compressa]|nr:hypothetical protein KM043_013069 [Ampulex compressa]